MSNDPILNSPGWNKVEKFCANCGAPVTDPSDSCKHCGFWFDLHDDSTTYDKQKAEKLREIYKKNKPVNRVDEDDLESEAH